MAPRGSRNWGLQVFFSPKTWQETGLKNIQKTITRKVRKNVKKVVEKDVPKSDGFLFFCGLGQKAPQGGPKDPPGTLQGQMLSEIISKTISKTVFVWCFAACGQACRWVSSGCGGSKDLPEHPPRSKFVKKCTHMVVHNIIFRKCFNRFSYRLGGKT